MERNRKNKKTFQFSKLYTGFKSDDESLDDAD